MERTLHCRCLHQLGFFLAAALAPVERDQLALAHVELAFRNDSPLVKIMQAQGLALVPVLRAGFLEVQYLGHDLVLISDTK